MRTVLSKAKLSRATLAVVALGLAAAGCNDAGDAADADPTVVASTPHVADIAANVAGDRAAVVALLPATSDPHDHEPRPSDAEAVAEAGLVLKSGGDLDLWMDPIVESASGEAPVVELIDFVATVGGPSVHAGDDDHDDDGDEEVDPHWWQDPRNAARATEEIRDQLISIDHEGRREYARNAASYLERLERLDRAIAQCIASVPARDRTLVTSHDSFAYFADRYGLEVVGAAVPALTTQAQPSAGETSELIELIRARDVRAIFPEAGLSDRLEEAIADQTDAVVGGELWADTLGPEGSESETYLGAMAENARNVAAGLGGDARSCPSLPDG